MNLHHDKEALEELIMHEIIENQVYKGDYEDITMGLLFVPESYDIVI